MIMKYLVFIALLCASCEGSFMQDFPTKGNHIGTFADSGNSDCINNIVLITDTTYKEFDYTLSINRTQ